MPCRALGYKEGRQEGKALRGNGRRDVWSDVAFFFRKHASSQRFQLGKSLSLAKDPHSSHRISSPGNERSYSTLRRTRVFSGQNFNYGFLPLRNDVSDRWNRSVRKS